MCRKYYWRYFADYKVSLPFCPPHMTGGRVFRRPVIFYSGLTLNQYGVASP
ncbi:MAG: hypothetical protein HXM85_08945 [Neisseria sp.]|nr:hypothetical protein [Neisseria sp.]